MERTPDTHTWSTVVVVAVCIQSPTSASDLTVKEGQPVGDGNGKDEHVVVVYGVLGEEVVERS